jgi:hypothetical protein
MAEYYSDKQLAGQDEVEFNTTDSKGKPVFFKTPAGAEVIVTGKPRPMNWTVQNGIGLSGATRRFAGTGLAEGTISLRMGGPDGARMKAEFKAGIWKYFAPPKPGENAKVFTVKHRRFNAYPGFPVVQIVPLDGPPGDWDRVAQLETVVFQWGEWRKPLPTLSSATTAGDGKDGAKAKSAAKTKIEAGIAQDTARIETLSTQLAAL